MPDRREHTNAFYTAVVEHWLERYIAQWVHHEGRPDTPSHHERTPPHFTHLPLGCMIKLSVEGNILFKDALNTFYLRLYGVRHMVKDHSDSERGNLLQPHRLLFPIISKGSFICIIPRPLLHQSWSTGWKTFSGRHYVLNG